MKQFLLVAAATATLLSARAQTAPAGEKQAQAPIKEGRIVYEQKVDLYRRMTDESAKSMIPHYSITRLELTFSGDESYCRPLPEEEDIRNKAQEDDNKPSIKINTGNSDETYKNYATQKMVELKELGPKKYLVDDSLTRQSWKLEEETRTIGGYTCKKATTKDRRGLEIIAWYTEDLQSPGGPGPFGGLPGMILELSINDAEILYTAREVVTQGVDRSVVKAPSGGKKISQAAFRQMVEEQMGPDSGGGVKIRIIHN